MSLWVADFRGHGTIRLNGRFPPGVIDRHSTILANICEIQAIEGEPLDFPFIGAAGMEIRNIAPRDDNVVDIWIEVDWDSDLNLRLRVVVF